MRLQKMQALAVPSRELSQAVGRCLQGLSCRLAWHLIPDIAKLAADRVIPRRFGGSFHLYRGHSLFCQEGIQMSLRCLPDLFIILTGLRKQANMHGRGRGLNNLEALHSWHVV